MARDYPYEVDFTVPVHGYEPVQFTLNKMCGKLANHHGLTLNLSLSLSLPFIILSYALT